MKSASRKAAAKGVTAAQVKAAALALPEVHEKPAYGKPSFFVAKKFFTRLRAEDKSLVLGVDSIEHRDMMLELDPMTYHITDHYRDYAMILVRIERITRTELKQMLERRWRQLAPKKLLKAIE